MQAALYPRRIVATLMTAAPTKENSPFLFQFLLAIEWSDPAIVAAIITAVATMTAAIISLYRSADQRKKIGSVDRTLMNVWEKVETTDVGCYYKASKEEDSPLLVVLVHGILGDTISTWRTLPGLLREASQVKFDLLSYGYPSKLLHRASTKQGADNLVAALNRGRFSSYQHVMFVVHSTGGLVVKTALLQDAEETLKALGESNPVESLVFRTNQIINIAVPHSGGSLSASLLLVPLYHLLLPILFVLWLIFGAMANIPILSKLVRRYRGYSFGYNKIIIELWYRNSALRKLEEKYRKIIHEFDRRCLPRPVSIEINGTHDTTIDQLRKHSSDDTIAYDVNDGKRFTSKENTLKLIFRGTHPSVKHAQSPDDGIVAFIASFFSRFEVTQDISLATETVIRSLILDKYTSPIGAGVPHAIEESSAGVSGKT